MSTSAPSTGLPFAFFPQAFTKVGVPGVGERTSVAPFGMRGASGRQNGPSRLAVVSVAPRLPLLSRQISVEKPSEPDISTASLWLSVVFWPSATMVPIAFWNSSSVSRTSRAKSCRWRTKADMISRKRGSGARAISASTALVTSSWVLMIIGPTCAYRPFIHHSTRRRDERAGARLEKSPRSGQTQGTRFNPEDSRGHRNPTEGQHRRQGRRPRRHGGAQRRGRPAQHLAAHAGERTGAAPVVPRHRHRGGRPARRRPRRQGAGQG